MDVLVNMSRIEERRDSSVSPFITIEGPRTACINLGVDFEDDTDILVLACLCDRSGSLSFEELHRNKLQNERKREIGLNKKTAAQT